MRAWPTLPVYTLLPPRLPGMKLLSSLLLPPCTDKLAHHTQHPPRVSAGAPRALAVLAGVGFAFSSAFSSGSAFAQSAIDDEFSVQRFNPAPGPRNYFTTRGVRTDGEMAWSGGLVINYAYKPFVVVSCETVTNCDDPNRVPGRDIDINVGEHMFTADLLGSFTPIERLQFGMK